MLNGTWRAGESFFGRVARSPPRKLSRSSQPQLSCRRTRSSIPRTDLRKCIICQAEKRQCRNRRLFEGLVRCECDTTPATLCHAAEVRQDDRVLLEIDQQDLWAKDILYHASCYASYVSPRALQQKLKRDVEAEDADHTMAKERAFTAFAELVKTSIIDSPETVTNMTDLCCHYVEFLCQEGVEVASYRSCLLKTRLKERFGDALVFHRPQKRTVAEYVFSSEVPPGPLVEKCALAMAAAERAAEDTFDVQSDPPLARDVCAPEAPTVDLFNAAMCLRSEIMALRNEMPFPPTSEDVSEKKVILPNSLYNFLAWVLAGDVGDQEQALSALDRVKLKLDSDHRHVLSIGQDLVHCVTRGRVKTPKHVALPIAIKQMTGSAKAVTLLNRFGSALSKTQLSEIEVGMAEKLLTQQEQQRAFVPSNITAESFVTFCWDNNDINEETLTGSGSTHCTNGIAIQRQVQSVQPNIATTALPVQKGRRRRSVLPPPALEIDYTAGKRQSPKAIITADGLLQAAGPAPLVTLHEKDFVWLLCRTQQSDAPRLGLGQTGEQLVSGWSAFNASLGKNDLVRPSVVGYLPVIASSPTELSTVYAMLTRTLAVADELQQDDVIIVLDQAIYAKAQEIICKHQDSFNRVILRMGSFHIACTLLAVIGQRFEHAGLHDIFVESGVAGTGAVSAVLKGKHYNRAMRCHKVVFEALFRLLWRSFEDSVEDDRPYNEEEATSESFHEALRGLRKVATPAGLASVTSSAAFQLLRRRFELFMKNETSALAKFWLSYMDMVSLLLRFTRATREGDWSGHLATVREILPWMFSYDRVNYSRYLPLYWCQMHELKSSRPQAYEQLSSGDFCVQRSQNSFSQIAVDLAIEQTVNRHTKTKGGIIGFSRRPGAVQQWVVNAHQRAEIASRCLEMAGLSATDPTHKEDGPNRVRTDERAVCSVLAVLSSWKNPFEDNAGDTLTNISSGVTAPEDVAHDLCHAREIGEEHLQRFVEKRLVKCTTAFHEPLKKLKLKTLKPPVKSARLKVKGKDVIVRADRNFFARLLVIAQSRAMDLRHVFQFSLGPVPWSLATPDGQMAKTSKSVLLHLLEKDVAPLEAIPADAVWIVDAMALLQGISHVPRTFGELAEIVFSMATRSFATHGPRVDFVCDRYPDISIKSAERAKRASSGSLLLNIASASQKCPSQWKKFLSVAQNKTALISFLIGEWTGNATRFAPRLHHRQFVVTCEGSCTVMSSADGLTIAHAVAPDLACSHEEADTRLLLHARHVAACGFSNIVMQSPDTDVAVLACCCSFQIPARLFFHTGTKERKRSIDINAVAAKHGRAVCRALPGLHAFTGCDSTSAFVGRGKKAGLALISAPDGAAAREAMSRLGTSLHVSEELLEMCEHLVCQLYGSKTHSSVNDLRYDMFCTKASQSFALPPTKDALRKHVLRANYQTAIWIHALVAEPNLPGPDGHGWRVSASGEELHFDWMDQQPAPAELLEFVSCGCATGCSTARCSCLRVGLRCTSACQCKECENGKLRGGDQDDSKDDDESDHDDDDQAGSESDVSATDDEAAS